MLKKCPRCGCEVLYKIRREKLKCKKCKYEFNLHYFPVKGFRLTTNQWEQIIAGFLAEKKVAQISKELQICSKTIYNSIKLIRSTISNDLDTTFSYIAELELYPIEMIKINKHIRHSTQHKILFIVGWDQYHFGYAELINCHEIDKILTILKKRIKNDTVIRSKTWKDWEHLVEECRIIKGGKEYNENNYTNNWMTAFIEYLKSNLKKKKGIKAYYLNTYIHEYVWKYNNQQLLGLDKRIDKIMKMLKQAHQVFA